MRMIFGRYTVISKLSDKGQPRRDCGFTMVEMAISMMIVGIIMAAFAVPYSLYIKNQDAQKTTTNLQITTDSLTDYLSIQGHYPCPARTDLPRTDANYGRETDCTDTSVAPGTCSNGICVESNTRTITDPLTGAPVTITQRVRVGNLPFRQMNLEENETIDGYGTRYKYAVTEELAVSATFDPTHGGVDIIDDGGNSVVTPPASAHYIVLSAGPDQKGGITRDNALIACDAGERQTENCNVNAVAVYRKGTYSEASGANQFDDSVSYFSANEIPLWRVSTAPGASRFDIEQIPGNGGVEFAGVASPAAALSTNTMMVTGGIKASGAAGNNGEARVNNLCSNPSSGSSTCFPSAIVAGNSTALQCPAGQVAREVDSNQLACVPINSLSLKCPAATPYVKGVNADGTLKCAGVAPLTCAATTKTLCSGGDVSLPAGAEGDIQTGISSTGFCRKSTYRCQGHNWVSINPVGSCVQYQFNYGASCGAGNTGTLHQRREYNCATNSWGAWGSFLGGVNTCTCDINATRNRSLACPSGFSGTAYMPQTRTCAPDGWVDNPPAVYSCNCTPSGPFGTTTACPGAMDGTQIINRYQYVCSPGQTYQALPDINNCTCDTTKVWKTFSACPSGYSGQVENTRTVVMPGCTWGPVTSVSNCTPIPPPVCQWSNNDTTSQIDDAPYSGNQKGSTGCTCGSVGKCYERVGPGQYKNYNSCTCGS